MPAMGEEFLLESSCDARRSDPQLHAQHHGRSRRVGTLMSRERLLCRLVKQHAGHVNALAGRPIAACTLVASLSSPAPLPPSPPAIPAVAAAAGPALNAPLAPPSTTAAAG